MLPRRTAIARTRKTARSRVRVPLMPASVRIRLRPFTPSASRSVAAKVSVSLRGTDASRYLAVTVPAPSTTNPTRKARALGKGVVRPKGDAASRLPSRIARAPRGARSGPSVRWKKGAASRRKKPVRQRTAARKTACVVCSMASARRSPISRAASRCAASWRGRARRKTASALLLPPAIALPPATARRSITAPPRRAPASAAVVAVAGAVPPSRRRTSLARLRWAGFSASSRRTASNQDAQHHAPGFQPSLVSSRSARPGPKRVSNHVRHCS